MNDCDSNSFSSLIINEFFDWYKELTNLWHPLIETWGQSLTSNCASDEHLFNESKLVSDILLQELMLSDFNLVALAAPKTAIPISVILWQWDKSICVTNGKWCVSNRIDTSDMFEPLFNKSIEK